MTNKLLQSLVVLAICHMPFYGFAQCPNNNTWVASSTPSSCPGSSSVSGLQGGDHVSTNVVAGNTYTFSTCTSTNFDTQITLYPSAGGADVGYNDDFCGTRSEVSWVATFTGGLRVLIDRYNCRNSGGSSSATLTITCAVGSSAPANDDPCNAIALSIGSSCIYTSGTNSVASNTTGVPAPTCANYTGGDVWYSFVAPTGGLAIVETAAGSLTDGGMAIYSASSCSGTFTQVDCDDDSGPGTMEEIVASGLTPGDTYYVRIWGWGGGTGTFDICVHTPPPPANDNPCGAISLAVGGSCSTTSTTNLYATATGGIGTPSCSVYGSDDVWYSFAAPASGNIGLETTAAGMNNGAMALYSAGSCSGTFTELECDDDDGTGSMPAIYYSGLTPGTTYYVRFWGILGESGTFDICAYDPADCKYTLHMYDLAGNGWSGATVSVSINGGTATNYTLSSGERGEASFDVNIGDNVSLSYAAGSGDESEISYILAKGDGFYFNDGPNPATGTVFTHIADCVKPAAPVEDCIGGMTLCNFQTINVDPMNEGITTDLNSTNRGCLGDNERQGQWYNFTPSSGGTIEMDIIPNNSSDDYDFAIWGPYTDLTCVPPEVPLRCSYSGDSDTTGLRIGSGDTSEGPGGDKFVDELTVLANEVYILYVSNWSRTGIASDINFNLSGGAALDCTVLPIELLDFSATTDDDRVVLKWTTSTETDNEKFVIERSRDAMNFDPIGVVQGAGNSVVTIDYEHIDVQPYLGVNYYRLRQVDFSGNESTSQVVTAVFDNTLSAVSSIYPNPAKSEISFNVQSSSDAPATVRIHDASGRLVRRSEVPMGIGTQRVEIPLNGLQRGSYSLELIGADGVSIPSGRFIVR